MGLFGSITRALFGGSKSKSDNKFAGQINEQFSPWVEQGAQGMGRTAAILGGGPEGEQALDDWWKSSGGQFQLEQGLGDVNDRFHSLGLGRSGSAMKAMEGYRSGLASTKLGEFLGLNNDLARLGLGAGGLITSAGQTSKGTNSTGGLGGFLGTLLGSDPRIKTDIVRIGETENGLPWYRFRYRGDDTLHEGLMSTDVRKVAPGAVVVDPYGFDMVHYPLALAA